MTNVAVCTLFERDYHHGVVSLANSLAQRGYHGRIYAGYRGPVPSWASNSRAVNFSQWPNARSISVDKACEIVLLPMQTSAHFTNIKPDFMQQVLDATIPTLDGLFYLDPDICLAAPWSFLMDWLSCGVALCEDVNSPLEPQHPRRHGWRQFFGGHGFTLSCRTLAYVNGGCVGVSKDHKEFLECWRLLSARMGELIGGLEASQLEGGRKPEQLGFANCFDRSDQDALNAAIEATDIPVSILPQSAMGFTHGTLVLPHAIGARKPWRRKYFAEALRGIRPTTADRLFWQSALGPLQSMSTATIGRARWTLALARGVGRFYGQA